MPGAERWRRFGRRGLVPLTPPDAGVAAPRPVPSRAVSGSGRRSALGVVVAPLALGAVLLANAPPGFGLLRDATVRLTRQAAALSAPAALAPAEAAVPPVAAAPTPAAIPWAPPPLTLDAIFGPPPDLRSADPADLRVLVVTGDVIPARSANTAAVRRNDFLFPYRATAAYLQGGDLLFINLEAPLLARCPATDEGMTFCGDARNVDGLVFAGVDVAGVANNHFGNYGPAGTAETMRLLSARGIAAAGLGQTAYRQVRGLTFAFLAYNGIGAPVDRVVMAREIGAARQRADVVVVQFHWGKEYVRLPQRAPGIAPDDPRDLARVALAAGADLIVGNHPHWVQGLELIGDRLVTYAHGNFVFDQMFSRETREGVVGRYTFHGRRLAAVEYRPVRIESWAQPRFLEDAESAGVLGQMEAASRALEAMPFRGP